MDNFPLIHKNSLQPCSDVSHVIREVFQDICQEEGLDWRTLENLEQSSVTKELKENSEIFKDSCLKHETLLEDISTVEEELMTTYADALVERDKITTDEILNEKFKLRRKPWNQPFRNDIMKEYLIRFEDLLPPSHELQLDFHLTGLQSTIEEDEKCHIEKIMKKSTKTLPPLNNNSHVLKKCSTKRNLLYLTKRKSSRKFTIIFKAEPDTVSFTGYEIGIKYNKYFNLKNVSNSVGKFDVVPLPSHSKFHVEWDILPCIDRKIVAPGLSVKMRVQFCADSLEDHKEVLTICVDGGKSVTVALLAHREAPDLRVTELLNTDEVFLLHKTKALSSSIECGQCLLGDTLSTTVSLHNNGGKARFWIISEEDWSFADVQDLRNNNSIDLSSFTVTPSYFTVAKGGVIDINIKFLPLVFGTHVEKLYVMCDNCSYRELDLIGEGYCFEDFFISVENIPKTFQIDVDDDSGAEYYLDLGRSTLNNKVKGAFTVANKSPMELTYTWKKRTPQINSQTATFMDLSEQELYVKPETGIFHPKATETFTVYCGVKKCDIGHYRHIFQLLINNIPKECLSENSNFLEVTSTENNLKENNRVSILMREVEVWLEVVPIVVVLEPCIIKVTGNKLRCDESPINKTVKLTNNSDSPLTCVWELVPHFGPATVNCCLLTISPSILRVYPRSTVVSKLNIKIVGTGRTFEKFKCTIAEGEIVLELSVEVEVDYPVISPSTRMIDYGLVKQGTLAEFQLDVVSESNCEGIWRIDEFIYEPNFKTFLRQLKSNLSADAVYLCHQGSVCSLVYYLNTRRPCLWGSLLGISVASTSQLVPTSFQKFILIIGDIMTPAIKIEAPPCYNAVLSPHDGLLYLGVEVKCNITLRNLTRIPASFTWEIPTGHDALKLKVKFNPESQVIPGGKKMQIIVSIIPLELGDVKHFYVACTIGRVQMPIVLSIQAKVGGLNVNFHIPSSTKTDVGRCTTHISWSEQDRHFRQVEKVSGMSLSETPCGAATLHPEKSFDTSERIYIHTPVESKFMLTGSEQQLEVSEPKRNIRAKGEDRSKILEKADTFSMTVKQQLDNLSAFEASYDQSFPDSDNIIINSCHYSSLEIEEDEQNYSSEEWPEIDFEPQYALNKAAKKSYSDKLEEEERQLDIPLKTIAPIDYELSENIGTSKTSSSEAKSFETPSYTNSELLSTSITESKSKSRSSAKINSSMTEHKLKTKRKGKFGEVNISEQSIALSNSIHSGKEHPSVISYLKPPSKDTQRDSMEKTDPHLLTRIDNHFEGATAKESNGRMCNQPVNEEDSGGQLLGKISKESTKLLFGGMSYNFESEHRNIAFGCSTISLLSSKLNKFPPTIYFTDVPCHEAVKKTFIIQNGTPIATNFRVRFTNFIEKQNVRKPCLKEVMFMKSAAKKRDMWKYKICDKSGIVFIAEPVASNLGPYETVPVDIWVYAETWGTYFDQIVCKVDGLLPYLIDVKAEVIGFPLHFPLGTNSLHNTTILRFGALAYHGPPQIRKVRITNKSSVGINVNWHVFIENGENETTENPFNLILDIFNPIKRKTELSESHLTVPNIGKAPENGAITGETAMQLDLSAYYGKEDYKIFQIRPGDLFIPPKKETYFVIKINPMVCKPYVGKKLHIKAVAIGHIRICEGDSYKEDLYFRPSGRDMKPVSLHLDATIEVPIFKIHNFEEDLIFKINATDVLNSPDEIHTVSHTLLFSSDNQAPLFASIQTTNSFEVSRVSNLDSRRQLTKKRHSISNVKLNPGQIVEVQVECTLSRRHIDKALHVLKQNESYTSYHADKRFLTEKVVTFGGELILRQHHLLHQTIQLSAHIAFPCLVVDNQMLDFGPVYIENIKQMRITVENKSDFDVTITISKMFEGEEFTANLTTAVLPPLAVSGRNLTEIIVSFKPSDIKEYNNKLLIETCIPEDKHEVTLLGVGSINIKYYLPG